MGWDARGIRGKGRKGVCLGWAEIAKLVTQRTILCGADLKYEFRSIETGNHNHDHNFDTPI
jgi:hypothetical protein